MAHSFDNIDFAVLSRIQEISERFGLKPYDLVATLVHSDHARGMGVKFTAVPESREADRSLQAMLNAIGVDRDGVLQGGEIKVIDALDRALAIAPKPRSRF